MNNNHEHHQHLALAVFASSIVTAIIVGLLVFQYQERQFDSRLSKTNSELSNAGEMVKDLQMEKQELSQKVDNVAEALSEVSTKNYTTGGITLPLVRYKAAGLFSEEEFAELEEKLIGPYTTYYNLMSGPDVLATMLISKAEDSSEFLYLVDAIHETGTVGFIFGEKNKQLEYWRPTCLDECDYPNIFKEKYPELVN